MNFKQSPLRDAVLIALAVGSTGAAGQAYAQASESSTTTLDRVQITGSRIRQVDIETAQPVLSISRQEIESQGFNSVADILQNISATGSPTFSRSSPLTANQEAGGQYVNLRNLGAQRTLVLVNGKRLGISPNGYADISTIPTAMVERIEVLKDGASSLYGSDAMAGVVNIITRKNFEGAQANFYTGQYSQGDGQKQSADFIMGFTGERGSVTAGAEYHEEKAVWAKDRWFSQETRPGYPESGLTLAGQWGNWRAANAATSAPWWAPNRGSDALDIDDFHVQTMDDTSNSADQMHLITPLKRRSLFVSGEYNITDDVRFVADLGYTKRSSERQIAGYPMQSAVASATLPTTHMSATSYFNPTNQVIAWRRRGWEVPRTTDTDNTTWRFTAGLEGSFQIGERYFDWDAGYLFNENDTSIINNGNFYLPAVAAAVGPSFLNSSGQVQCGTAAAPIALTNCVPWNPFAGFGTGAVANSLDDPALQKYLFREEHAVGNTKTNSYFANLTGSLFTLPAGDLGFAVGYEYRKEEGGFSPDSIAQSGNSTNLASGPTYGSYNLDEYYLELNIPLLADLPGAKELSVSAASRYSDYNTFGDTINSKFGFKWRPFEELLVRGTWSEGFRAPTIGDLYGGGSQTFATGVADPCDTVYGVAAGSAKCLADTGPGYRQLKQGFVPSDGQAVQTPVPFTSGSNPNLMPELSTTKTLGFVYSPGYLEGFTATVDWWNIRIENTMVSDSPNLILSDCYVSLIESRCANFKRDPNTRIVTDLVYGLRNAGYTDIEGFDFDFGYRVETGIGNLGAKLSSTYFSKYESKATNDAATVPSQSVGRGTTFRLRSNLALTWNRGDWSAMWGVRYFSGAIENCTYGRNDRCSLPNWAAPDTLGRNVPKNELGANTFHDVQIGWKAPWDAKIAIGANNVFNHTSAPWYSQASANFAYYGGFDMGRFLYLRYQQNF